MMSLLAAMSLPATMSTGPIISVRGVGKKYVLGGSLRHDTFRDHLTDLTRTVLRRGPARKGRLRTEEFWALKDVSFDVQEGQVLGIIGRNGSGKSTLLKVLSQITEPTTGEIRTRGRIASLLEVGTGFHPELTGRENVFLNGAILGMRQAEIKARFDEIVAFSGVERFLETPVKRYSSGMYVRLAFAVAAHLNPEILIVDEVLAVGDTEFQGKCLGKMGDIAKGGRTVLFVSHNLGVVRSLCPVCLLLEQGEVASTGATDGVVKRYLDKVRPLDSLCHAVQDIERRPRKHESPLARFEKLWILDHRGEPAASFVFGETMRLRLKLRSTSTRALGVEVFVRTAAGDKSGYFASEHFSGVYVGPGPGQTVELVIPSLPFARGKYRLDVGLTVPKVEWLDYVEDVAVIEVIGCDPGNTGFSFDQSLGVGEIHVPHEWCAINT
jgi:lipopolysaccharide transport system ATP-binding protein